MAALHYPYKIKASEMAYIIMLCSYVVLQPRATTLWCKDWLSGYHPSNLPKKHSSIVHFNYQLCYADEY